MGKDEQARRKALISPVIDDPFSDNLKEHLETYVHENFDDSDASLYQLIHAISTMAKESSTGVSPWLNKMLAHAPTPMRVKIEEQCIQEGPSWLRLYMQELTFSRVEELAGAVTPESNRNEVKLKI